MKSFTAEAAKAAEETKSFTAEGAKVAKEQTSSTAKDAKDAEDYKIELIRTACVLPNH